MPGPVFACSLDALILTRLMRTLKSCFDVLLGPFLLPLVKSHGLVENKTRGVDQIKTYGNKSLFDILTIGQLVTRCGGFSP